MIDALRDYLLGKHQIRGGSFPLCLAQDLEIDDGLVKRTGEDARAYLAYSTPSEVDVIAASPGADDFAIAFEYVDEITGLTTRSSWHLHVIDGEVSRLKILRAPVAPQVERSTVCLTPREYEWGFYLFGFRNIDLEREVELVERIDAALADGADIVPTYNRHGLLLNSELVYVPWTWVGCSGYLVRREDYAAAHLGSGQSIWSHIWAYYKGLPLGFADEPREAELVIEHIANAEEVQRVLQSHVGSRYYQEHLRPLLRELPAHLEVLDLWHLHTDLWRCELRGVMTFHVEITQSAT